MGPMGSSLQQEMGQDHLRPKKPKDLLCSHKVQSQGRLGMGTQTSALGTLTAHRAHLCSQAAPPEYDSRKCLGPPRETLLLLSVTSSRRGCLGGLLVWGVDGGAGSGLGEAFASRHQYVLSPLVKHPRGLGCLFISAQAVSTHTWAPPKGEETWETGQSMRQVSPFSTLCPAGSQWGGRPRAKAEKRN